jgi:diguanylate cyclase (GGDEF)-like protein
VNIPSEIAGAAIVCDLHGVITRIAHDQLGITGECTPGTSFVEIVDEASMQKAADFVTAIRKNGAAFDWQLCMVIRGQIVLLHCMGFSDGSQLWIILAGTQVAAARVLEEMSLIQNEQTGMLRAALKYASQVGQSARDESQYEDLTRLYNDLGRMQRELAQRNAELEAMRAKLEAKQAELIAANAKLDALATTDGLTGIANRRTFQRWLEAECSRTSRSHSPLALMMLDVDHFKGLNDTYGHQAGDEVLRTMGRLLTSNSRNTDFVARFGGEEFAVILVDTDKAAAREAAERLRMRIESEPWPHRAVTASIGVASWGPGASNATDLIDQADEALYFSKKHGRNRATHCLDIPGMRSVTSNGVKSDARDGAP